MFVFIKFIALIMAINYLNDFYKAFTKDFHPNYYQQVSKGAGKLFVLGLIACCLIYAINGYVSGLFGLLLEATTGALALSYSFDKSDQLSREPKSQRYFNIGLVASLILAVAMRPYNLEEFIISLILIGLLAYVYTHLVEFTLKPGGAKKQVQHPVHSRKKSQALRQHYQDHGLDDQAIRSFREEMSVLRQQIYELEDNLTETAKLRAIADRHKTIEISQNFFKEIVAEPQRLLEASDFVQKSIPTLLDLTEKYNEINGHVAKNKQTYLIMEKSATVIEEICQQIAQDYINFHAQTYADMEDQIKYAERNIIKEDQEDLSKDELIDQIIEDLRKE